MNPKRTRKHFPWTSGTLTLSYMSCKGEIKETAKLNQSLVYDSHQSSSLEDLRTKDGNKMTSCFRKRPAALQVSTWLSQHFGWLAASGKQDTKKGIWATYLNTMVFQWSHHHIPGPSGLSYHWQCWLSNKPEHCSFTKYAKPLPFQGLKHLGCWR